MLLCSILYIFINFLVYFATIFDVFYYNLQIYQNIKKALPCKCGHMHSPLLESLFEFSVHGFRVSSYKAVAEGTVLIVPEDLGSIGIALWQI